MFTVGNSKVEKLDRNRPTENVRGGGSQIASWDQETSHQEIGADEHLEQELQKGRTKEQGVGHLYGNHGAQGQLSSLPSPC